MDDVSGLWAAHGYCAGSLLAHPPTLGFLGSPSPVDDTLSQGILLVFPPIAIQELGD